MADARKQQDADPQQLVELVQGLASELNPGLGGQSASLDSYLERDLGLDSLARMEMLARLEKQFHCALAEQKVAEAETLRDVWSCVRQAQGPGQGQRSIPSVREGLAGPPPVAAPTHLATLIDILNWQASNHGDSCHITLLTGDDQQETITFASLLSQAQGLAAGLQRQGLQPGQSVALMLPTCGAYFASFFAVLLAGAIPVPLYPPGRASQLEEHLQRHRHILANARAHCLITVKEALPFSRLLKAQLSELAVVSTAEQLLADKAQFSPVMVQPQDTAFLQYTSGSTGNPKGVILSHANLLANIRAMGQAVQVSEKDVFVSWLPLCHDMGLIGAWLGSLVHGCQAVIMSPLSFIAKPLRWLQAIAQYGGTLSPSPNFGYELCLKRLSDEELAGLDLSSWRLAFNGAEPVSPRTIDRFCHRFAPYGFRPESMAPVYGLAESSVGLAFPPLGRQAPVDRVARQPFMVQGRAMAAPEAEDVLSFVGCGRPLAGHAIRIVDESGRELPERQEGRLQFQGPSATSGYFHNPQATADLFAGDWLDSGDLAYQAGEDIFLTGRRKDIIIKGGRNICPYELEEAVGRLEGVRAGAVAVFGSTDARSGSERLVVLAETRKRQDEALQQLRQAIHDLCLDLLAMPADDIVLAPPNTVLKTSSGKIRRAASKELYEQGTLGRKQQPLWIQLGRTVVRSVGPLLHRGWRWFINNGYAAWCWTVFSLLALLSPLPLLLPRPSWRWSGTRLLARLLALLTLTRVQVRGAEQKLPAAGAIVVSNHQSYLDAFLLMAALPWPVSFIAKKELSRFALLAQLLGRLDVFFVERHAAAEAAEDARQLQDLAARGKSLLFFSEGTFRRWPGLLPFRLGAFQAAVEADLPVIPVTIRGSRAKLRAESWFPRRGSLQVIISPAQQPVGKGWPAVLALRQAVRQQIFSHCGEPDIIDPSEGHLG